MQETVLTYVALGALALLVLAGLGVLLLHAVTRVVVRLLGTGDD